MTRGSRITRSRITRSRQVSRVAEIVALPLAAVILLTIGWVVRADEPPRRPGQVEVAVTAYSCPLVAGATVAAGQVRAGASANAVVYPGSAAREPLANAKVWRTDRPTGAAVAVEQRGRRSGAVGFVASRAAERYGGGLLVAGCSTVDDEAWFTGLGSGRGHDSSLVLTNFGGSPAVADLNVWAADGPVPAVGNIGIVVEPHTARTVRVAEVANGEPEVAVQVVRRRGSLSAVAFDTSRAQSAGTELVSGTAPSTRLLLSAVPAKSASHSLLLLNPGTQTARATVRVLGSRSPFTPEGLKEIELKPGQLSTIELPSSLAADAYTLDVTSDHAVTGSVRYRAGRTDFAYASAATPLTGVAVAPVQLASLRRPHLLLTASEKTITVVVTAYDANMKKLEAVRRKVTGGSTLGFDTNEFTAKDVAYLTVSGGAGLVGAASYADRGLYASLPLFDAPVSRPGPHVQPGD